MNGLHAGKCPRGLRRRAISPESGFFRTGVHALLTGYLVGLQLVLVANDLAIQFVHQIINGGIHVLVAAFGVHIASFTRRVHSARCRRSFSF